MSDEHDALAERLAGFQALMEQALKHIQSQLDDLSEFIVGRDKFENLSVRVEAVEKHTHETDVWRNSYRPRRVAIECHWWCMCSRADGIAHRVGDGSNASCVEVIFFSLVDLIKICLGISGTIELTSSTSK